MSNPFAISSQSLYMQQPINPSTYVGGGQVGPGGAFAPATGGPQGPMGPQQTGPSSLQNELSYIGGLKSKEDFGNGLGGTNDPSGHKLFYAA